jgi:copper chaperone CopZ
MKIMTHTYHITGMTCSGCQSKVQALLTKIQGIKNVAVDLNKEQAEIEMDHHIPTNDLKAALKDYPKYQLSEVRQHHPVIPEEEKKSWIATYKPILLVFAYITGISLIVEIVSGTFFWMRWMNNFMAGFFLTFSFFKLLDLKGFADSYMSYDIVARKWMFWGLIYPFIELLLGIAYLSGFNPLLTNSVTLSVMSISVIGVLQTVLNKRTIRCACLGSVFNLPMSTITIIEDVLMILMSAIMLVKILF